MALLEDIFKGNAIMTMAIGVGSRPIGSGIGSSGFASDPYPTAKAVIKGGYVFYRRGREQISELGEFTTAI